MAEPAADSIRRLIGEVDALPKHEMPGFMSWAYNHPGVLTSRTKDPRQYDADMRRAHFLERVRREQPDYAHDAGLFHQASRRNLEQLRSPYQPYSVDGPLSNAGRWAQSLPAAVMASGQMLADAIDPSAARYPNAADDYAKSMNNFLVVAEPFGVNKNHMRDMADMRDAEARLPWKVIVPPDVLEESRALQGLLSSPKTGSQYLAEAGVQGPVGNVWGAVMDATLDPLYSPSKALKGVAMDYGPGVLPEAIRVAVEAYR